MKEITRSITYTEFDQATDLPIPLQQLLSKAKSAIANAYAPYSKFKVGAAVLLQNGEMISGSNQENASSPVGICAERVALSAASAMFPSVPVISLAVSAKGNDYEIREPVSPCGLCRQTILEYEFRFRQNIEIVLQGEEGKIFLISTVKELLPLNFSGDDLKK